jgi:hypothetical protein
LPKTIVEQVANEASIWGNWDFEIAEPFLFHQFSPLSNQKEFSVNLASVRNFVKKCLKVARLGRIVFIIPPYLEIGSSMGQNAAGSFKKSTCLSHL